MYTITQAGFVAVTFVYFAMLLTSLRQALGKTGFEQSRRRKIFYGSLLAIVVWLAFTAVMADQGFFRDFSSVPPKFFIVIIVPLITVILVSRTRTLRVILVQVAPEKIVYLQSFRIFVEVFLWMLFLENVVPVQMSFEGRNFDVIAGLTALPVGYFLQRGVLGKKFMVAWNIVCLLLLINIVTIALLSAPLPFRVFMNEPANTFVTQFPFVWLPGALVPLAYSLHIFSLLQLTGSKQ